MARKLMKIKKNLRLNWWKHLLKTSVVALLLVALSLGWSDPGLAVGNNPPARKSSLAQGNAITDPVAILRYALPIDNETVRRLQASLEDIANQIKGKRWSQANADIQTATRILSLQKDKLKETVPPERESEADALIDRMQQDIVSLKEAAEAKDKDKVREIREEILDRVGSLEFLMVEGFPFKVPEKYSNLPQLLGRAKVDVETTQGNLTIVVDGYSAPVNGGNFVDLVQRGFYNGLKFIRAGDDFVIQTGDPEGEETGFIDPKTGKYRTIPLEVLVQGYDEPIYETTLEDLGMYLESPVIPFNAYGAVALARPNDDPNGGSSQFFFFKFDNELTPPGFNLVDGRYSVFGYVVKGAEVLDRITEDDKIISAKVVSGIENLVEPS
jgi:peptidylprolyl isomerase